jgi:hypothetical protein
MHLIFSENEEEREITFNKCKLSYNYNHFRREYVLSHAKIGKIHIYRKMEVNVERN